MFLADGACWGAAGMVRAGADFTDRETEFLTAVAPAIAAATRLAVRSEAQGRSAGVPARHRRRRADGRATRGHPGRSRNGRTGSTTIAPGRFRT